jgi:hypothetical protein
MAEIAANASDNARHGRSGGWFRRGRRFVDFQPRDADIRQAALAVALQAAAQQTADRGRRRRRQRPPIRIGLQHRGQRIGDGFAAERRPAGEHFE